MNLRSILAITFFIVALLVLFVALFSIFIQPILPPETNMNLVLSTAAIFGVLGFLSGIKSVIELIERLLNHNRKPRGYRYRYFGGDSKYLTSFSEIIDNESQNFLNRLDIEKRQSDNEWIAIKQNRKHTNRLREIQDYTFIVYKELWQIQQIWFKVNGRYFQGKNTMPKPPGFDRDGKVEVGFGLTDQVDNWQDIGYLDDYAPVQLRCGVYESPKGHGFTVSARIVINNSIWKNQMHYGPENSKNENNFKWQQAQTDI